MDEAEIAKQKYISVLVGSLDAPNQTFLVDFHPFESGGNVNSSIILHASPVALQLRPPPQSKRKSPCAQVISL